MKIKDYKCKCGENDFFFDDKGNQTGIYCSYCGKWLKWADKDEQSLRMKQEPVLDKIRAKIEQIPTYDQFTGESYSAYEFKSDVLDIIDKYRKAGE